MYTRTNDFKNTRQDLSNYIEGIDVYNSRILDYFRDRESDKVDFTITKGEFRPDLIAEELYGSSSYMGLFILTSSVKLEDLYSGNTIRVFPKNVISEILEKFEL